MSSEQLPQAAKLQHRHCVANNHQARSEFCLIHAQPQHSLWRAMIAVTGEFCSAVVHAHCFALSQSLGRLLVALHSFRFLKKLKLDFTAFSSYSRTLEVHLLNADALMALDCLWRQMEDLRIANGSIRFGALFAP